MPSLPAFLVWLGRNKRAVPALHADLGQWIWLLLSVCALALLVACSVRPGAAEVATRSQDEPATISAREAYPLAEEVATRWRRDAELRSVRAAWQNPGPAQLREGKTSWAFYFVSPSSTSGSRTAGYIVSVSEGRAEGVREGKFSSSGKSLTFVDWKLDSPQALRSLLENGGQDFLARHAQTDVHLILQGSGGGQAPVWEVTLLDKQTRATLSLQLDASNGKVRR